MTCPTCEQHPSSCPERGYIFVGVSEPPLRPRCRLPYHTSGAHHGEGYRWWTWGNGRLIVRQCAKAKS